MGDLGIFKGELKGVVGYWGFLMGINGGFGVF